MIEAGTSFVTARSRVERFLSLTHLEIETYCRRIQTEFLKEAFTCEDLSQKVILKALEACPNFKNGDQRGFLAWIQKLARFELKNSSRTQYRKKRHGPGKLFFFSNFGEDGLEKLIGPEGAQPNQVLDEEGSAFLIRSLQIALTASERRIIELFYLKENSAKEVARRLNISISAVYKSRESSFKKLRLYFELAHFNPWGGGKDQRPP